MTELDIDLIKQQLKSKAEHISFDKKEHKYTNQQGEEYFSASTIIDKFTAPFNTEKISNQVAKRDNLSVDEVMAQWDIKRDFASIRGTELHFYIETYLNTGRKIKTITPIDREIESFHLFWESRNKGRYEVVATEAMVCDDEYKIAGTVDCIVRQKDTDDFFIFDWKSNRKIKTENKYQKMVSPLNHLDDCHFTKYSLQMTLYRYMLQKSGVDIKKCFLIHFLPKEEGKQNIPYKVLETENYIDYISTIFNKIMS